MKFGKIIKVENIAKIQHFWPVKYEGFFCHILVYSYALARSVNRYLGPEVEAQWQSG